MIDCAVDLQMERYYGKNYVYTIMRCLVTCVVRVRLDRIKLFFVNSGSIGSGPIFCGSCRQSRKEYNHKSIFENNLFL